MASGDEPASGDGATDRASRRRRVPARVAICGGGVAALEAVLALREILAVRPHIDLIAPNEAFRYVPMAVAEPFGLAQTRLFEMTAIAADLGVELHAESLQRVEPDERRLFLGGGTSIEYDAAIVAVGARHREWLGDALSFGGPDDVAAFGDLLERVDRGEVSRVAFVAPPETWWTLPIYELALLTAAWVAERDVTGVELTIVTPETDPLGVFGDAAAEMVRGQLSDRGIRLRVDACAESFEHGQLRLSGGASLEVDEVVALPRLEGPRLPGLPADEEGFIPVDRHCAVTGLNDVYAAGDATCCRFKQGGIATQQADVAAACVAAGLGAASERAVFEPLLRGMLLTGLAPMYMRVAPAAGPGRPAELAANALWWPPTKIAGRYLGPYLSFASTLEKHGPMVDRPVIERAGEGVDDAHREARELALVLAEADARGGDFRSALGWLEAIEHLDGVLPTGYLDRREGWREGAAEQADRA
ncbi:MAG: FAD-dependent oxidoreductase [Solirubrobacteraceae bacterium]